MAHNTNLPTHHAMMAESRRAGNANLSYQQTMRADLCTVTYRN
jgi:hypothetical protein